MDYRPAVYRVNIVTDKGFVTRVTSGARLGKMLAHIANHKAYRGAYVNYTRIA